MKAWTIELLRQERETNEDRLPLYIQLPDPNLLPPLREGEEENDEKPQRGYIVIE